MSIVTESRRLPALLNDLALLATMLVIAAILTTAMTLQYGYGELPCPLCLLQRAAMFGICFGVILHFRHGYSVRNTGVSLLFALFLLIVSVRQTLLDIYPRPGHSYIGSTVLGVHMPVWSILIALAILLAFAIKLTLLGGEELRGRPTSPALSKLAGLLSLYVIALCAVNFVSVILQCGLGECHTFGYKLL
jgi:disulfide bond formation protein DsbB